MYQKLGYKSVFLETRRDAYSPPETGEKLKNIVVSINVISNMLTWISHTS